MTSTVDSTADVADIGLQRSPQGTGDDATLVQGGSVSPATLDVVVAGVQQAGAKLESADSDLQKVQGDAPLIGDKLRSSRDSALNQIHPTTEAYRKTAPLVAPLPALIDWRGPSGVSS